MTDKPIKEGRVWNTKTLTEATRMLEAGLSRKTVAKHFNSSVVAMRNGLIRYGMYKLRPSYEEAITRIETLEAALREIKDWNDNQDRRSLKIAAVIDAALAGEKKDGQAK
jgi:hypothetical protein